MNLIYKKGSKTFQIKDDDDRVVYSLNAKSLSDIRQGEGDNLSEVICQLKYKIWVDTSLLYQVAALIQEIHPSNQIDWVATFFPIEKKGFRPKSDVAATTSSNSLFSKALESIVANRSENSDTINEEVESVIKEKLRKYSILKTA